MATKRWEDMSKEEREQAVQEMMAKKSAKRESNTAKKAVLKALKTKHEGDYKAILDATPLKVKQLTQEEMAALVKKFTDRKSKNAQRKTADKAFVEKFKTEYDKAVTAATAPKSKK